MAEGAYITPEDLELQESTALSQPLNLKEVREEAERKAINRALNHCSESISEAATALGITRPTLYNLLVKYGMKP